MTPHLLPVTYSIRALTVYCKTLSSIKVRVILHGDVFAIAFVIALTISPSGGKTSAVLNKKGGNYVKKQMKHYTLQIHFTHQRVKNILCENCTTALLPSYTKQYPY